jgi:FUS-interacting serine-arginine-rich protein 1
MNSTLMLTDADTFAFDAAKERALQRIKESQSYIADDGSLLKYNDECHLDLILRTKTSKGHDFQDWINIPKNIRPIFSVHGYVPQPPGLPITSIVIRNITSRMTAADIRNLAAMYGPVRDVYIPENRATGQARNFAFVEMLDETEADAMIKAFESKPMLFGGRRLVAELAVNGRRSPMEMRMRDA